MFPVVRQEALSWVSTFPSLYFCFLFCCQTQIPVISSLLRMISRNNSLLRKLPLSLQFVWYLSSHKAVHETKLSSLSSCFLWGLFFLDHCGKKKEEVNRWRNEEIQNYMILWIPLVLVTVGWQHTNVSNPGHLAQGWSPSLLFDIHQESPPLQ